MKNTYTKKKLVISMLIGMAAFPSCRVSGEELFRLPVKMQDFQGEYFGGAFLSSESSDRIEEAPDKKIEVTAFCLNVRNEPNADSRILTQITKGETYPFVEEADNGWYRIEVGDGTGWVNGKYVVSHSVRQQTEGQEIVDFARRFIGNPYVWGGTSLTEGADCSGFVQSVYRHFGIGLPRTSYEQRSAGYAVEYENAMPGDLILYDGHVGIYMGNGTIVNAMNEEDGIGICSADYTDILCVRRVL